MSDIKQLTNVILWNGNSITSITWAKGEGNGHFYHISVIEFTISWDPIR